ncbi:unnamed protein product [Trichogramma brassicae]|uniref:Uncharacterized protein n=1 Tax=Trichogramma brassicae TaxID=86971 RepID=A0A6H5IVC5_9HYME|nr:unnamed protein product [Trichogramma brassicae]
MTMRNNRGRHDDYERYGTGTATESMRQRSRGIRNRDNNGNARTATRDAQTNDPRRPRRELDESTNSKEKLDTQIHTLTNYTYISDKIYEIGQLKTLSAISYAKVRQIYRSIQEANENDNHQSNDENEIQCIRNLLRKSPPSLKSAEEAIREEFEEIIQCPDSHQGLKKDLRAKLKSIL